MTHLRLIDPPAWNPDGPRVFEVGDCWYASPHPEGGWAVFADGPNWSRQRVTVAPEHERGGETPMMVVITLKRPPWCLHAGTTTEGSGWVITGSLPNVTVHPSINMIGDWHGWVRDGALYEC